MTFTSGQATCEIVPASIPMVEPLVGHCLYLCRIWDKGIYSKPLNARLNLCLMSINKPNYTQVPNDLLGDILPGNQIKPGLMAKLEGSELKVYLAVCRLTFGYHQNQRRASYAMLETLTGLSRQGIINAANKLEYEYKLIKRSQDGGVTLWQAIVNSVDNQDSNIMESSSQASLQDCQLSLQGSQLSRHPSKKETLKETKKKKSELPPLAVQAYRDVTNRFPNKATWPLIAEVGELEADLERWKNTIIAWIACSWNPSNVGGMLDYFRKNEMPTTKKNGAYKNGRNQPKNQAATSGLNPANPDDWKRMLKDVA